MSEELYGAFARQQADRWDIPADGFMALIGQESDWRKDAVSERGAAGLCQLMPATALMVGTIEASPVITDIYVTTYRADGQQAADAWLATQAIGDYRLDPYRNMEGGAAYLAYLARDALPPYLEPDQNVWAAVLAAYNWGPGNVIEHLEANGGYIVPDRLPPETRDYLDALLPSFPRQAVEPSGGSEWLPLLVLLGLLLLMGYGGRKMLA